MVLSEKVLAVSGVRENGFRVPDVTGERDSFESTLTAC